MRSSEGGQGTAGILDYFCILWTRGVGERERERECVCVYVCSAHVIARLTAT